MSAKRPSRYPNKRDKRAAHELTVRDGARSKYYVQATEYGDFCLVINMLAYPLLRDTKGLLLYAFLASLLTSSQVPPAENSQAPE